MTNEKTLRRQGRRIRDILLILLLLLAIFHEDVLALFRLGASLLGSGQH
ncbi:hypothetical protein [Noviherbaspirillum galbum]|uniref:Uncharacterized protein n=1 Tax=Noviherbaspirillum galbum TaxID=2709383 RepID=A0A6B3SPF5_9BURK|nr:hypothetical protein [Noviherbaspirillum galbum]NEX59609.1 hypothetical protein [Noviherbaspirillum galbum]